jgi:hypothetical protein
LISFLNIFGVTFNYSIQVDLQISCYLLCKQCLLTWSHAAKCVRCSFFVLCHFWRVFTSWTVSSRVIRVKVNLCIFKGWMYFNPKPSELYLDQINAKRKTYFCNATLVFDRLIFYRDSCDDTMSCRILTNCVWVGSF